MSMTREEAIRALERVDGYVGIHYINGVKEAYIKPHLREAVKVALTALRPVSREQVEKVWPGCQMCDGWNTIELKPCANGDLGVRADIGSSGQADPFGLVVYNKLLASGYVDFKFCPFCGSPKTDEAVEMVMERWEALYENP